MAHPGLMVKFKPDKKDYPPLKTDDQYPKWRETMSVVLHSHGLQLVLDVTYTPLPRDIQSYHWTQRWVYSVLYDKVQTYHGRAIVRRARDRLNATQVIMDLDHHYNDSTAGRITAGRLLAYLTSADLDSSWNKPYSQFLTEWLSKAEQYNDMCDLDARLHETALMHMLQRAVYPVPFLRQLTNQEHLSLTKGEAPLTFVSYYRLALSTAITHDAEGSRGRRRAFVAQLEDDTHADNHELSTSATPDIADETDAIARIVNNATTRPRLPDEVFSSFTPEDRKQWIGLSRDGKQQIVKMLKGGNSRTVNNVAIIDTETDDSDDQSQTPDEDDNADTAVITANQAQSNAPSPSSDAHPADLRRVLAQKVQKRKKTAKRSASMATVRRVGVSQRDDPDSDSEVSLGLDDTPSLDLHSNPMFDNSPAGLAAWHTEMKRVDSIPTGGNGFRNDYQTLATYVDDYEDSASDHSSDDDGVWCDTRNSYYDSLDFY